MGGNWADQARLQSGLDRAKRGWRAGPAASVLRDLEQYAQGRALEDCQALSEAMHTLDKAQALSQSLMQEMGEALAAAPLAHVPLRHQYQAGYGLLEIARSAGASLSLIFYEDRRQNSAPTITPSAVFEEGSCHEIVLSGGGSGRFLRISEEHRIDCKSEQLQGAPSGHDSALITARKFDLSAGSTICVPDAVSARVIDAVLGGLTLLRLSRGFSRVPQRGKPSDDAGEKATGEDTDAGPFGSETRRFASDTRQYALENVTQPEQRKLEEGVPQETWLRGRLIHRASGDLEASKAEMAMSLLGAMKRKDAASTLSDLALASGDSRPPISSSSEPIQPLTKAAPQASSTSMTPPQLRWQALRQLLTLDTKAGFDCLTQIARGTDQNTAGEAALKSAEVDGEASAEGAGDASAEAAVDASAEAAEDASTGGTERETKQEGILRSGDSENAESSPHATGSSDPNELTVPTGSSDPNELTGPIGSSDTTVPTDRDPLAGPALALRRQLLSAHPQLASLENCPDTHSELEGRAQEGAECS